MTLTAAPARTALAAVQMLVGGVVLLTISLATGDRLDVARVAPVAWWAYMSVVVTPAAFSAYAFALSRLPV